MIIIDQSTITGRNNLYQILPDNFGSQGVEVGTHRGEFAGKLLSGWRGVLFCVDPYVGGYDEGDPVSHSNRNEDRHLAKKRLHRFGSRAVFIEDFSENAVKRFDDLSLDFVYVDGNHRKEYVRQDLELWWPKVKRGGFLAGHDIICPHEHTGGWGKEIQPAVFDFAKMRDIPIKLIIELDGWPWSYLLEKP